MAQRNRASVSRFRQITTSPKRLLAFIRFRLTVPAQVRPLHALRFVGETGAAMAG
jgi:hypothetical protein